LPLPQPFKAKIHINRFARIHWTVRNAHIEPGAIAVWHSLHIYQDSTGFIVRDGLRDTGPDFFRGHGAEWLKQVPPDGRANQGPERPFQLVRHHQQLNRLGDGIAIFPHDQAACLGMSHKPEVKI
jgi:hypothetical protein